MWILKNNRGKS